MAKFDPAAVCMFCGGTPCECNDVSPKHKQKTKPAPHFPAAESVAPARAKLGPLASAYPSGEVKTSINHTARALQALLNSSVLSKSSRGEVKIALRKEVGDPLNRKMLHRIDGWKERNHGSQAG